MQVHPVLCLVFPNHGPSQKLHSIPSIEACHLLWDDSFPRLASQATPVPPWGQLQVECPGRLHWKQIPPDLARVVGAPHYPEGRKP